MAGCKLDVRGGGKLGTSDPATMHVVVDGMSWRRPSYERKGAGWNKKPLLRPMRGGEHGESGVRDGTVKCTGKRTLLLRLML